MDIVGEQASAVIVHILDVIGIDGNRIGFKRGVLQSFGHLSNFETQAFAYGLINTIPALDDFNRGLLIGR